MKGEQRRCDDGFDADADADAHRAQRAEAEHQVPAHVQSVLGRVLPLYAQAGGLSDALSGPGEVEPQSGTGARRRVGPAECRDRRSFPLHHLSAHEEVAQRHRQWMVTVVFQLFITITIILSYK